MTLTTRGNGRGWAERPPNARAWRGRTGRSRQAVAAEQDRAAGGRDRRLVEVETGLFARASVELKLLPNTRRVRAYLRWSDRGRSPSRYLGEVSHATRAENLAEGWNLAWAKGLLASPTTPRGSWATTPAVRSSMRANKCRDTGPERRLRSILHRAGLRYRVSVRPVPSVRRTADVVFPTAMLAVFVDGCFWHGCDAHYRPSRVNADFWSSKIEANRSRDRDTDHRLGSAGWAVIRVWEHDDPAEAAVRIEEEYRRRIASRSTPSPPRPRSIE